MAMAFDKVYITFLCVVLVNALEFDEYNTENITSANSIDNPDINKVDNISKADSNAFEGVYTECFVYLSYTCLQEKTLLYLKELHKLKEISLLGDFIKFVKVNVSDINDTDVTEIKEYSLSRTEDLSVMIDKAVDKFFNNHILKFSAFGRDIIISQPVEGFVGRKKRKGDEGGGDDIFGKKKMMMMAMMCMKMKLMMMVPAMMGMMGMMSFKGMIFGMMSFMMSKMMLIMKLLEKKTGGGGFGGSDGGWMNAGGSAGAWMPAGTQDYGGSGGYDANGQWQSRSILDNHSSERTQKIQTNSPIITYVKPIVRYNNNANERKPYSSAQDLAHEIIKINDENAKAKSRKKRSIIDVIHNTSIYWINRLFGKINKNNVYPKYKNINGIRYVFLPIRQIRKPKLPKAVIHKDHNDNENITPPSVEITDLNKGEISDFNREVITDFNKREIVETPIESRMNRKKIHKIKHTINDTIGDNPWE